MSSKRPDDSDSPWKDALEEFLPHFLSFLYPTIHKALDWSRGYESLDKELHQIIEDAEVGKRLADKLFKVWDKKGKEAWLLIHVEIQDDREKHFPERMFTYWYRIRDLYSRPVVSIAVLCDADPAWKPSPYRYNEWGCETTFRYLMVKVLDYVGQESRLETDPNPMAAIVLAQLKAIETKDLPGECRIQKLRLIKGLFERGMNTEQIRQLFRLIDWILTLPVELEDAFRRDVYRLEEEKNALCHKL